MSKFKVGQNEKETIKKKNDIENKNKERKSIHEKVRIKNGLIE